MSHKQYFTVTVIILVIFVMFQVTGVLKDYWNEYDKNEYAAVSSELRAQGRHQSKVNDPDTDGDYVVIIGDGESDITVKMAKTWCEYEKLDYFIYDTLRDAPEKTIIDSEFIILDFDFLDSKKDTPILMDYADNGVYMVFSNLPDTSVITGNASLRILLGIYGVRAATVTLEGITLFDNFLLGGKTIYKPVNQSEEEMQDLVLDVPWYTTYSGVKRYMMGILNKDDYGGKNALKDEDLPAIIWRNSLGDSKIFVVNGDYMDDVTALGIYSAIVYEMNDYSLYPVVNAQSFAVVNFASLSSEYDDKMYSFYSRTQKSVFRDIIWPMLCSVYEKTGDIPTFFISPKMDYSSSEEPDADKLIFYYKMLREENAENGLTLSHNSQVTLNEKLRLDVSFYNKNVPGYKFLALYSENESNYRTVMQEVCPDSVRTVLFKRDSKSAPFDYASDNVTAQYATINGFEHTYSDNLRMKSLQTSLGYSSILLDLEIIVNPQSDEDSWEKRVEKFSSYTYTFWKPFRAFEKTSLSTSDMRIRQFLNMDYEESREGDVISLKISEIEDKAYFILRTHEESIASLSGGTYKKIENNAYLIEAQQTDVEITLKNDVSLIIK